VPGWLGLDPRTGVAGLTASAGIAGWVEFYLLRRELTQRIGSTGVPSSITLRLWLAAILSAAIGWGVKLGISTSHTILAGLLIIGVYGVSYLLSATVMRIPEASAIMARLRR
jgi:putative peptidoglycan lipid II flippase